MPATDEQKKLLKALYSPSDKRCEVVDAPEMAFLMLDGVGDPNDSPSFEAAMQALYSVSYALKFAVKKAGGEEYAVMPLEGLWWTEDGADVDYIARGNWRWTLMIVQPEFITRAEVEAAMAEAGRKKELLALDRLRFERFHEGRAAQVMHIGPYADEPPTIERLHRFVADSGWELHGRHHEVYLSDPRRADPAKMKTILRHPIRMPAA